MKHKLRDLLFDVLYKFTFEFIFTTSNCATYRYGCDIYAYVYTFVFHLHNRAYEKIIFFAR